MKTPPLILAACLFLASWLPTRAEFDPSLQQNMIWTVASPKAEGEAGLVASQEIPAPVVAPKIDDEPSFVAFRKTFSLAAAPKTAELRIFADLRYLLWVNGRYIVRGPVRFDPKAPQFDVVDLASNLQPGENSLAVLVLSRATNNAMMAHAPGLAAELRVTNAKGKTQVIKTDESWRWNDKTSFLPPDLRWNQGSWSDRIDARIDAGEWTQLVFDASGWKTAQRIDGGQWGVMRPRTIPLHTQIPVPAKPVGKQVYPVEIAPGSVVVFDSGKMVQGYLVMEFDAQDGTQLEIEPSQRFEGKKIGKAHNYKAMYTARAGRQTYMSTGSFGCRYIAVRVTAGSATINNVTLVDRRYPYQDAGSFTSSDPFLNELWKRAVHTIRMNSEDGHTDSALREQNQWIGDASVSGYPVARVTLAGPGNPPKADAELMKNVLRHIAQSQLSDGRMMAHHPSNSSDIHGYIEDYSCLWVQSLRAVYDHTADKELVEEVWPNLLKQMDWFLVHRTHNGLIFAREFVIFDNPFKYRYCEGATLNAFVYKALLDSAYLGEALGETKQAAIYREAAAQLYKSYNQHLWNEEAGTYSAAIVDFENKEPTCHAALLALNRGLVPESRRASVTKYIEANLSKITMPYTHYWVFEEQYRCDNPEQDTAALNTMRKRWAEMMKITDSGTLWERLDKGEACHNFGAVPAAFLTSYVLGARMEEPVWKKHLLIEPRPGDLSHAEGVVVTELGLVPIEWRRDANSFSVSFTVPPGATATLRVPKISERAQLRLNGKTVSAKTSGRYLEIEVPAGKHSGTVAL
jgi:hypothetical protein